MPKTHKYQKLVAVFAILALCSCSGRYQVISGYAQGGCYTVKYNPKGVKQDNFEIRRSIGAILDSIDRSLSGYNAASTLSRYNAGERTATDPLFERALGMADGFYRLTGGAVDCWAAPLFDLWGFGFGDADGNVPSEARVREALDECAGRGKVNFNSFAQGLSCDMVAEYLRGIGVKDMLVDIGEIYCCGLNPRGQGWTVAVDNPVDGNETPGADIRGIWSSDGKPCGIVTSGNYRKFFVRDSRKYSHTIDPRTGYPVEHTLLSATVVAPSAALADAMATFCMVSGPEEAQKRILAEPEMEAYFILSDGVWASPGFNLISQE